MSLSGYTVEQIIETFNYKEICSWFHELVKDSETLDKLDEILYTGGYGDYSLRSSYSCLDNPSIESCRRISMAYLLVNNPETFDYFANNNINIFHGTNASALSGISQLGIKCVNNLVGNKMM